MPIVSIPNENIQFEVAEGEVLFDALDSQGHQLPHGCLAGSCGACRIEILEGDQNLKPASPIEENTIAAIKENFERIHGAGTSKGKIVRLSCRAKVLGDVSIKKGLKP